MAWVTPTLLAISAASGLASAAMNSGRNNNQQLTQSAISGQGVADAAANKQQADMVQALINQRSIASQTDSSGTSLAYDPATNTWKTTLGKVPQQVQDSADQAAISRNTTDLRQAQFANEQSAKRAALAQPYADATRRDLESFKPMGYDQLTGLLQQQATNASNSTFSPLVADTLRSFARTGTSAGPVLGQIGRDASKNLRDSLIDAQIKGMTGADSINQSKRSGLEGAASNAQSLATPAFGYTNISASPYSTAMTAAATNRATGASTAPAYGASASNAAEKSLQDAYGNQEKNVPNTNYGTDVVTSSLNQLGTATGSGGSINNLISALTKNSTNSGDTLKKVQQLGEGGATPDALAKIYGTTGSAQMYP
jgi:hypothetical protein